MKTSHPLGWALVSGLLLLAGAAGAKVATISVSELAASSDRIVLARVEELQSFDGLAVARAAPLRVLKGTERRKPFYFVAGPTWACDVSAAVKGETAMLFLTPTGSDRITRKLNRRKPARVPVKPLYLLTAAGRGRWPLSTKQGRSLAAVPYNVTLSPRRASHTQPQDRREHIPLTELEGLIRASQTARP